MKTVTPSSVAGYVVVRAGIDPKIDDMNLFAKIRDWRAWCDQFRDVALVPLLGPTDDGLSIELPAPAGALATLDAFTLANVGRVVVFAKLPHRWLWRLRSAFHNSFRRRSNRAEAERQRAYFSPEGIEARVRASQVKS